MWPGAIVQFISKSSLNCNRYAMQQQKWFDVLKTMWSPCKAVYRKKSRKNTNSEMGRRFITFSYSVSLLGIDTGSETQKAPSLRQPDFTCLFHLPMDTFFWLQVEVCLYELLLSSRALHYTVTHGKRFKERWQKWKKDRRAWPMKTGLRNALCTACLRE